MKEPRELSLRDHAAVEGAAVMDVGEADLRLAFIRSPRSRSATQPLMCSAKVMAALAPEGGEPIFPREQVAEAFHSAQAKVVRWNILDHQRRIDGCDMC